MSERVWNPNVDDLHKYILELEMKVEHAERALAKEREINDDLVRDANTSHDQIVRLETRLAEAEKKLEWVTADYATTVDVLNLVKQQRDEAEQRGRALSEALGALVDSCAYPEFDDVRLDYISVQIDRDDLARAKAALTPGALSAPPSGVDKPAATMLGQPISMDELKRISKDGP